MSNKYLASLKRVYGAFKRDHRENRKEMNILYSAVIAIALVGTLRLFGCHNEDDDPKKARSPQKPGIECCVDE